MAKSISLFFGVGTVFLGWKIANILWDSKTANKVGWIIALFPSLILYSALVMREAYISFFFCWLFMVVDWANTQSLKSIIIAMLGFVGVHFSMEHQQ